MCGRYQLQASADAIAASHRNTSWRAGQSVRHTARQQLRPTNHAPVVIARRPAGPSSASSASSGEAEIVFMKWGMSPAYSQQSRPPLINARRETLLKLPTFRNALKRRDGSRRCAIPTTGFYEWKKTPGPGKPTLTPYLVKMTQGTKVKNEDEADAEKVTYMAGLYDRGDDRNGEDEYSFVIITTDACKQYEWLHDRQPVFLTTEKAVDCWLDHGVTPEEAVAGLHTENGLSWTRMAKDLSEPAKGKLMVQRGLDSFFAKKDSTKNGKEAKRKDSKPSPRKSQKPSAESLALAGGIRKKEKGSKKGGRGK